MSDCTISRLVRPLSFTVVPFGQYHGQTFDSIPLEYLDWLWGQDWLYGELRARLGKYLAKPVIQRELDWLFPDRDFVTTDVFSIQDQLNDHWHGQPMPEEEEAFNWHPRAYKPIDAWSAVADFVAFIDCRFESESYDPNDLMELDFDAVRKAVKFLGQRNPGVVNHVRAKYRAYRKALKRSRAMPARNIYRLLELGLASY